MPDPADATDRRPAAQRPQTSPPPRKSHSGQIAIIATIVVLAVLAAVFVVVVLPRFRSADPVTSPSVNTPSTPEASESPAPSTEAPTTAEEPTAISPSANTLCARTTSATSTLSTTTASPWAKTYGGSHTDSFESMAVASNGDIIVVGWTVSSDGDFPAQRSATDAVVARLTPDGALIWANTCGGSSDDYFVGVTVASNGDIIAVGHTFSTDGDFPIQHGYKETDAVVIRFTPDGTPIWANVYGGDDLDSFTSVTTATNGDIIAAGSTTSFNGDFPIQHEWGDRDPAIVRLSPDGTLIWGNTYGGEYIDLFSGVTLADNGDIIAAGVTYPLDEEFPAEAQVYVSKAVVARVSPDGTLIWNNTYGDSKDSKFSTLTVDTNGDIIAAGYALVPDEDYQAVLARLEPNGALIWSNAYGGDGGDVFESVTIASNGDIIAAGHTNSSDGDFPTKSWAWRANAVVARLSPNGTLIWGHAYGGDSGDYFKSVAVHPDGDIIAVGSADSTNGDFPVLGPRQDALVVRLGPTGELS